MRKKEFIYAIKKGHHDIADGENMDAEVCQLVDLFCKK